MDEAEVREWLNWPAKSPLPPEVLAELSDAGYPRTAAEHLDVFAAYLRGVYLAAMTCTPDNRSSVPLTSALRSCDCPEESGRIYHQQATCTDPVANLLEWWASPQPDNRTTGQPDNRTTATQGKDYVCPQCGPDRAGADAHAESHHTWPPPHIS